MKSDIFDILDDYGIPYDRFDTVISTTPTIENGSIVKLVSVKKEIVSKVTSIPFKEKEVKTYKYYLGERNVVQAGVLGAKTQLYENYYEDGELVYSKLISETITRRPKEQIVEVGEGLYSLDGIKLRGYNCPYWYSVVDAGPYTEKEKQWMKYVMYCESGCNAESNKSTYKGLFQWSPTVWREQFPNDNIFDGEAQIRNTIAKIRMGVQMDKFWPACHSKYIQKYGEY